jgi:hypothetical protein
MEFILVSTEDLRVGDIVCTSKDPNTPRAIMFRVSIINPASSSMKLELIGGNCGSYTRDPNGLYPFAYYSSGVWYKAVDNLHIKKEIKTFIF